MIVAGLVTLLFSKLKQPVVLGYIVAGFLVGPNMPYIPSVISGSTGILSWAEIGVTFLMFCLGLEFSVKKIIKQGLVPMKAAVLTVISMFTIGFFVGQAFNWDETNCIFLGGMLAMSSTTIIYKAFTDMHLSQQKFTATVMSVLILEDIFGIIMMVVLHTIAAGSESGNITLSLLSIMAFLLISFSAGIFFVPALLRRVRGLMTPETLLITSLALCCLMAFTSEELGFSTALGSFIIGSVMSETSEIERIKRVVEPVKDLFGAIFFVSVGMLVDPAILINYAFPILTLVLAIIIGQSVFGSISYFLAGENLKSALCCGFSMTQIGEFSFIIATMGVSENVISNYLYPVVVAVSVITTFTTPYLIKAAVPAYGVLKKILPKKIADYCDNHSSDSIIFLDNKYISMPFNEINSQISKIASRFYLQSRINAGSLPQNAYKIMNRDIHISEFTIPEDSLWIGKTLMELQLGTIFSVHISSILRSNRRINIPMADERLFPGDRIQVIGSDEDLSIFSKALMSALYNVENHNAEDMTLKQICINKNSIFYGKNLIELNLRENYHAMVVGIERGEKKLSTIAPDYVFQENDIIWIVGEKGNIT